MLGPRRALELKQAELLKRTRRFSLAEFRASELVPEMLETLAAIARDTAAEPELRRLCALDVIERADGKPAVKVELMASDTDEHGAALGEEVAAVTAEFVALEEAERWINSGADPSTWPEAVRRRFRPETLIAGGN